MYRDIFQGLGDNNVRSLRNTLLLEFGLNINAVSAEEHLANCWIFCQWLVDNMARKDVSPFDKVWVPIHTLSRGMWELNIQIFLLDKLDEQLSFVFRNDEMLSKFFNDPVARDGRGGSPGRKEVIDEKLDRQLRDLYFDDMMLFDVCAKLWRNAESKKHLESVPRFEDFLSS